MRKIEFIYMIICRLLAVLLPKKECVLLCSFFGKYSDNPKYVSLELEKLYPNIKQIWVVNDITNSQVPSKLGRVLFGSFKYYYLLFNSRVVVDNSSGLRTFVSCTPRTPQYYLCKWLSRKTDSQYNIATWHGTPLKKIGLDAPDYDSSKPFITNADYSIAGCDYTYDIMKSSFRNSFKVYKTGTPRNDILCGDKIDKLEMKEKLGLPIEKKIILFAPTFRKNPDLSGFQQLNGFDYKKLLAVLSNKFGGEWCFVFRVHSCVENLVNDHGIIDNNQDVDIRNGNEGDDMAEYLYCSDILLTDYSSSMFDYLLTKKPCLLYTPDIKEYLSNDRGVYMSFDSLPFPQASCLKDLYAVITNFDLKDYDAKTIAFQQRLGNFEDGLASKRISDDIFSFIHTKKKFHIERGLDEL